MAHIIILLVCAKKGFLAPVIPSALFFLKPLLPARIVLVCPGMNYFLLKLLRVSLISAHCSFSFLENPSIVQIAEKHVLGNSKDVKLQVLNAALKLLARSVVPVWSHNVPE